MTDPLQPSCKTRRHGNGRLRRRSQARFFIIWDSGSHLSEHFWRDEIRLLSKAEVVKAQCRKVAATGRTNMFDTKAVFKIAMEMGFNELANFISTDTKRYANLILTGELENVE
jgi:hypothetical protein